MKHGRFAGGELLDALEISLGEDKGEGPLTEPRGAAEDVACKAVLSGDVGTVDPASVSCERPATIHCVGEKLTPAAVAAVAYGTPRKQPSLDDERAGRSMRLEAGLVRGRLLQSPLSPRQCVAGSSLVSVTSASVAEPRELTPPLFEGESDESPDVEPEPHCPPSEAAGAVTSVLFGGDSVDATRCRQAGADLVASAGACRISPHSLECGVGLSHTTAATAVQQCCLSPSPSDGSSVAASFAPQVDSCSPTHPAAAAALALANRMRTRLAACLNEQLLEARQRRGTAAANADEARSATEVAASGSLIAATAANVAEARAALQREAAAVAVHLADEAAAAATAAMRLADKSAAEAIALRREAAAATAVATAAADGAVAASQTAKQAAARVRLLEAELAELGSA